MGDNVVDEIIFQDEEEKEVKEVNALQETIKEISNSLFIKYPEKTSNLSNENINGMIQGEILNSYMERNFGYRYDVIDTLIKMKQTRVVSVQGFGITKLIEAIKSIQATFEQTQLPNQLQKILNNR